MTRNPKPWHMALPALGLLCLAAIWSGFWYWSFTHAKAHITEWRAGLAAKGTIIECGNESWSGYPFRVEMRCSPGRVERGGNALSLTKLTIMAQAYDLGHVLVVNDGETIITDPAGEHHFTHEGAIASLLIGKNGHVQADAQFTALKGEGFEAQSLALHGRTRGELLELALSLEGGKVQGQSLLATLNGTLRPVPQSLELSQMAAAGSELTLDQAVLGLGPAQFTGDGRLRLLEGGTPDGRLSGRITHLPEFLDSLAEQGVIDPDARQGAGLLLGLMGAGNPEGMNIDLLASQGYAWIGPIRVLPLPRLF